MMPATNIVLAYGTRVIFKDVNIKFIPGNCYGLSAPTAPINV